METKKKDSAGNYAAKKMAFSKVACKLKKDERVMTAYLCVSCIKKYNSSGMEILDFDELQDIGSDLWPLCGR